MKKLLFFIPILGAVAFAVRGCLYSDLEYTVPNVLLLGIINGTSLLIILNYFIG